MRLCLGKRNQAPKGYRERMAPFRPIPLWGLLVVVMTPVMVMLAYKAIGPDRRK